MFEKKVYPDEIANYLINNTEAATDGDRDALTDVIYNLLGIAENELNEEAYRTLYKALEELTSTMYEIKCTYYGKRNNLKYTATYSGHSFADAYNQYLSDSENHDLAKYTPREIASVDSYTTI